MLIRINSRARRTGLGLYENIPAEFRPDVVRQQQIDAANALRAQLYGSNLAYYNELVKAGATATKPPAPVLITDANYDYNTRNETYQVFNPVTGTFRPMYKEPATAQQPISVPYALQPAAVAAPIAAAPAPQPPPLVYTPLNAGLQTPQSAAPPLIYNPVAVQPPPQSPTQPQGTGISFNFTPTGGPSSNGQDTTGSGRKVVSTPITKTNSDLVAATEGLFADAKTWDWWVWLAIALAIYTLTRKSR